MRVTTFIQHLLELGPQNNVERLSFYHFLKNIYDHQQMLTIATLSEFYKSAFHFRYWQENQKLLCKSIEQDVQKITQGRLEALDYNAIDIQPDTQFLVLENTHDLKSLIEDRNHTLFGKELKIKILPLDNSKLLALTVLRTGDIKVEVFTNQVYLKKGTVMLLPPVTELAYDSQLELKEGALQKIQVDLSFFYFKINLGKATGHCIQGHHFRKTESLSGAIHQYSPLFFGVKALESHFVDVPTDPFYQEVRHLLEKSLALFKARHPDSTTIGHQALKKGKIVFRNVFPNDKLLQVLLSKLEYEVSLNHNLAQGESQWQPQKENLPPLKPI